MSTITSSGSYSFNFSVCYKVIESGKNGPKPLIIYLHGYKQNMRLFEKKMDAMLGIRAFHLFMDGPYPIYDEAQKREVEHWGRAWYLYDGRQLQFINSMEKISIAIERLTNKLHDKIPINRIATVGYSMGGYLAGYFSLSRPYLIDDVAVIAGRFKTEHFEDQRYPKLRALGLHGHQDRTIDDNRQKKECEILRKMGASVTFKQLNESHKLNASYIKMLAHWFLDIGYDKHTDSN